MKEPSWRYIRGFLYGTIFILLTWFHTFKNDSAKASEGFFIWMKPTSERRKAITVAAGKRSQGKKELSGEKIEESILDSISTEQAGEIQTAEKGVKTPTFVGTVEQKEEKQTQTAGGFSLGEKRGESRLPDKPTEFHSVDKVPPRPPLLIEIGDPFLHQGNLNPGFELPGGAVWQPRLWIFGTLRTAFQSFDNGVDPGITELASRFDLFANLQLTGTEKLIVGVRPLDRNRVTEFTRYVFSPENSFRDETNFDIRTLFFEGDIGSLFPFLDPKGTKPIDLGFSVGRQPLVFQDGILINDTVDAVGIVRNNIHLPGVSNLRATVVYGWGELDSNRPDPDATMIGVFLAADLPVSTVELDGIYVKDDGQGNDGSFHFGVSSTQRLGELNTTFRANASIAEDEDTVGVSDGVLLSAELSYTPHGSDDNIYLNLFWAIDNYTQAGREPVVGGPLATFGILFASVGLSNYLSELSSRANEVAGGALGYQAFWDNHRKNIVFEVAGRFDTSGKGNDDIAVGIQYQHKLTERLLWQIDTFYTFQDGRDDAFGGRTELLYQF